MLHIDVRKFPPAAERHITCDILWGTGPTPAPKGHMVTSIVNKAWTPQADDDDDHLDEDTLSHQLGFDRLVDPILGL